VNVLVVSPHADDETLGAGGTILRHVAAGDRVCWLNCTEVRREYGYDAEFVKRRSAEVRRVVDLYGLDRSIELGLRPAHLDEVPIADLVQQIAAVFNGVEPHVLILPSPDDAHSDHRRVFEAAHAAAKSFRAPWLRRVMTMEILSETDFSASRERWAPNYFVDISAQLERKIEVVRAYEGELGEHPFPRSEEAIRAQALLRGAAAGMRSAEAFAIVKECER
jgi:LmbE family N-acetylglucosaminyl deacetylase